MTDPAIDKEFLYIFVYKYKSRLAQPILSRKESGYWLNWLTSYLNWFADFN